MGNKHLIVTVVLGTILLATPAFADTFGLPNFAVFGSSGVNINDGLNATTVCVTGNVGTAATGAGTLILDKCLVQGSLYLNSSSVLNLGSNGAYSGSLVTGSQASVVSTMSSVSSSLNGLSANQTISGALATDMTFTNTSATGGTYVIDIGGGVSLNSNTLTFSASNVNDKFVVNVVGNLYVAQSNVVLNGVSAANIIFNLTSSGCAARVNKSNSTWSGTILGPGCDIRVDNPHPFDGEAFGNTVTVDSAGTINGPTSVPEPGSLMLFGSGFSGLSYFLRRRKR